MKKRQVVLDTETTGLSPAQGHRIIEIGCLEIVNRELTGRQFHQYINPQRAVDEAAVAIHGITDDFLLDKLVFSEIVDSFIEFIADSELIIHNAPFDVGFLNHEFKLVNESFGRVKDHATVIDTLAMARRKHPGQANSLDALCRRYRVDRSHRELHGALLDSELLAQVYLLMTGGQTQLFSSGAKSREGAEQEVEKVGPTGQAHELPVRKASAAESERHEQWVRECRERGECSWPEGV